MFINKCVTQTGADAVAIAAAQEANQHMKEYVQKKRRINGSLQVIHCWENAQDGSIDEFILMIENQQISKTEPGDGSGGQTDGGGGELTWRDKIGNIIADIGDWGKDVITDVGSTLSNEWNNFTEWVDNSWVGDAWDWVKDNKTIQTIAAAIIATAVIVGGIALLVLTFPAWGWHSPLLGEQLPLSAVLPLQEAFYINGSLVTIIALEEL